MLPERRHQILVVDDELNLRRVLAAQLSRDGYDVHTAADGAAGLEALANHHIDLLITDLKMPGIDGMELLRRALRDEPELPVVMITAHGTVDNAVEALKTGAFDYITKPFDQSEVRAIVKKALETRRLASREAHGRASPSHSQALGLIGHSDAVRGVNDSLVAVAADERPVFVVGESGTGKEIVARSIHDRSARREAPFIKVNCAATPAESFGQELFGATSPSGGRPGRLELAAGGTLFLDEIGSIPVAVQSLLAQALDSRAFERVGGVGRVALTARVIAASRFSAEELEAEQAFAPALAKQLFTTIVRLPPLRERREDIRALAADIIANFNARFGKQVTALSDEATAILEMHAWPGNVRELENVLEQAVLLCDQDVIVKSDLPGELTSLLDGEASGLDEPGLRAQVKAITARVERQLIHKALAQTQGNVTHAARLLKISRKGLQLKMKELGLRERDE